MNKAELIEALATKLEVSKVEAGNTLETVLGTIIDAALAGECVLPGLGKLVLQDTAARTGVTKLGGVEKAWSKPASKTLKLKLTTAGKALTKA